MPLKKYFASHAVAVLLAQRTNQQDGVRIAAVRGAGALCVVRLAGRGNCERLHACVLTAGSPQAMTVTTRVSITIVEVQGKKKPTK